MAKAPTAVSQHSADTNILEGKRVLITGGTGSLGKVLLRRILGGDAGRPTQIIVLSRDEAKQHQIRVEYQQRYAATDEVIYKNFRDTLSFRIGDVRDYASVCAALHGIDIVFNAAALKQVPTCEYFPYEAVQTNITGPENIVRAIRDLQLPVEVVVGISTDKAVKPVNVMGMTKSIQERIFARANLELPHTRIVIVRYGNVLASRGSVIPLFHQQIRRGGPVTVTADTMTRFLMTLDQAVDTVFEAVAHAERGEIVVPVAPSANVIDIAKALIGSRTIEIRMTEVRPGEKEHEILVSEEECRHTYRRGGYYVIAPRLPELRRASDDREAALNREYSSADAPVGLARTAALLQENQLMVDQVDLSTAELLR